MCGLLGAGEMSDEWIRDLSVTEVEVLRLCAVYAPEGLSVRPSARSGPCDADALHCTKCNWYAPVWGVDGKATGPTLVLQHLMMCHIAMYERAMFHAQRKASKVGRDLWQGKSKDNMTLDLMANKHAEAGGSRIVFYCSLCRQYASDDRSNEQFVRQTMHEHMEVCHRKEYNEARRFASEAVDLSEAERAGRSRPPAPGGGMSAIQDAKRAVEKSREMRGEPSGSDRIGF